MNRILEDNVLDTLRPFVGMIPREIEAQLDESLNPQSKNYYRTLSERMLKNNPVVYRDYYNSGILLKTIRVNSNGVPRESMSFPYFRFDDMLAQDWNTSDFKKQLSSRFLFIVFELSDEQDALFKNAAFWSCPDDDLDCISKVWNDTKEKVQSGRDDYVSQSMDLLAHVRPHGLSSDDTYVFNGVPQKKYGFWLNKDYIASVIRTLPALKRDEISLDEPPIEDSLESRIIKVVSESKLPVKAFKLKSMLQDCCTSEEFETTLLKLVEDNQIQRTPLGMQCIKLPLLDMLNDAPQYVQDYFKTNDIDEYCSEKGIQRNLLENDVRAFFTTRPEEESFALDFSTYNFTKKQFISVYGISSGAYRYLELMHPRGWKEAFDLLSDPTKTNSFKDRLRNALFDRMDVDGTVVTLTEEGIIEYILSRSNRPLSFTEVNRKYKEFIKKQNLGTEPFAPMSASRVMELANATGTRLLKYDGATIVRFPFGEKEVTSFFESLELEHYDDMYISTGLLLARNPSEFQKMGIETEIEAFMLFSKYKDSRILKERHLLPVTPPSLKFGNGSTDEQIVRLLRETGRITKNEFCHKYAELYGTKEQSLRSYMSKHPEYSHGQYYDLNLPVFSEDVLDYLRPMFEDAILSHEDAQNLFKKAEAQFNLQSTDYTHDEDPYYNVNNIRLLGYTRDKSCIFSNKYKSLTKCIESEYLSEDFIRVTPEMRKNNMIMKMIDVMIDSHRAFIVEKNTYISAEKLHSCGISNDMLIDYCENASTYLDPGHYYTLHFLHEMGFEHPLEDYGFDCCFYEGLLEKYHAVTSSSINNVKVFTTGTYSRPEALADMVSIALGEKRYEDVNDLADDVEKLFGIQMLSQLKKKIEPFRYCKHTQKIYRDNETYIEEMRSKW